MVTEYRQRQRQPLCTLECSLTAPIFGGVGYRSVAGGRGDGLVHLDRRPARQIGEHHHAGVSLWLSCASSRGSRIKLPGARGINRWSTDEPQRCRQGRPCAFQPDETPRWPAVFNRTLEPIGDVVAVRETGVLRRLRGGVAALAAATNEVDLVIRGEARLLQLIGETTRCSCIVG